MVCSKRVGKPAVVKSLHCTMSVLKEISEEISAVKKDLSKSDHDLENYAEELAIELEDLSLRIQRGKRPPKLF